MCDCWWSWDCWNTCWSEMRCESHWSHRHRQAHDRRSSIDGEWNEWNGWRCSLRRPSRGASASSCRWCRGNRWSSWFGFVCENRPSRMRAIADDWRLLDLALFLHRTRFDVSFKVRGPLGESEHTRAQLFYCFFFSLLWIVCVFFTHCEKLRFFLL